ncbi:MAG: DegT/DnrJ/EryC1/StrS family aminotransferase [Acidobacteria bacterium]|nr:DegT/DnrJ/EryC1/StrS family aminotransferase [Acidobacteriota bacterium]MCW5970989.1 DegT/DnrJ/EryC1/StrS family aminotransferase [Blastocatellales bacterium]
MKVPLLDLQAQHRTIRDEMMAAVERVFDSQQFILGSEVTEFEREMAAYCGSRHAVGCASGSDALLLALMALGVGPGDEVITVAYTFFATGGSIARLGARPVFIDIRPDDFNIDTDLIERAITPRTKAIMPVHLFGQCAMMDAITGISRKHNLPVIEDAAQAIGADYGARRAGAMSAIGCFSFFPSKNLGGAGDAGMLTTDDDEIAAKLRILRVHGMEPKYYHQFVGVNSRLDALQAAVLRVKLKYLDAWSDARAQNAHRYDALFAEAGLEEVVTPIAHEGMRHIYNQYTIRAPRRDELLAHLRASDVGSEIYYPVPLHMQECFAYLGYGAGDLPESERAAREALSLPIYPELTPAMLEYVVERIGDFYRG